MSGEGSRSEKTRWTRILWTKMIGDTIHVSVPCLAAMLQTTEELAERKSMSTPNMRIAHHLRFSMQKAKFEGNAAVRAMLCKLE